MKELKTGDFVDFSSIDEFTGKKIKLTGKILGDYLAVRKKFPTECAEIPEGFYLIKVENCSGFFVVDSGEILSSKAAISAGEYGRALSKLSVAKDKLHDQTFKIRELRKKLGAKANASAVLKKEIRKSKRLYAQVEKCLAAADAIKKTVIR